MVRSRQQRLDEEQGESLLAGGWRKVDHDDRGRPELVQLCDFFNRQTERARIAIFLAIAMLLFLAVIGLGIAITPSSAGVIRAHDPLNQYEDGRRLQTSKNTFKIVLFSDLHYGERGTNNSWVSWADEADAKSTDVMRKALSDEKPDFVVFGGDQITGENTFYNVTGHQDHLLSPVIDSKIHFASVYGNHDESYNVSHISSYLHEQDVAPKLTWTQRNPSSSDDQKGQFNYFIPLYEGPKPVALLWFFDSRSGTHNSAYFGVKDEPWLSQDWVDPKAAEWINATAKELKGEWGTLPPSLVFVHIPPVAVGTIEQEVQKRPADFPGINFDTDPGLQADRAEFWHKTNPEHPWWAAITGTLASQEDGDGGLLAVVAGHDHGNDWCGRADSVGPFTFCFARHTGYGGYGTWARGSRVFEFETSKGKLDKLRTWIRMEDHSAANTTTLAESGKPVLQNSRDAPY